jgi:glycosyltransferase involved in cell wall biosynthesis
MGAGAPVLAFDCEFNREVTNAAAFYWHDADSLATILDEVAEGEMDEELNAFADLGRTRIAEHYQWDAVTDAYEAMLLRLDGGRRRTGRRSEQATTESLA